MILPTIQAFVHHLTQLNEKFSFKESKSSKNSIKYKQFIVLYFVGELTN